ncbi:thiamine pyrophosphate transporter [Schizosaccharomyces japonicus yFS275]|uniref:Thiamine pyrophosphate transporter n=1 Tax=Schizosaccharomyces japonicus (strain yFS275 / FY16936) TaxID=402676 RepID=B6JWQ6_SCHJY|nr:thiamine pyrophosphate transporter [Schizosaccharomyces japonicus yFS275]EEB05807.1 thiamine pyrophosphate transporter [Schizosaccharomyces japonicus yFS275]
MEAKYQRPAWHHTVAGALGSGICRLFVAPLDVMKIRMQVTQDSLRTTFLRTLRGEGLLGFWRGNLSAEFLYLAYGSCEFFAFSQTKRLSLDHATKVHPRLMDFMCGALAGSFATAVSYPFDTMRTRFAAQTHRPHILRTVLHTLKTRGIADFYPGLGVSVVQIAPYIGCFFTTYRFCDDTLSRLDTGPRSFLCGIIAGATSKTLTFPADTLKRNLQAHSNIYHNTWQCLRGILRADGIRGLYRGLAMSLTKVAPGSAITMFFYEETMKLLEQLDPTTRK